MKRTKERRVEEVMRPFETRLKEGKRTKKGRVEEVRTEWDK